MKVLHVYSGNLYGGIETLLVTLGRRRDLCPALEPAVALCFDGRLSRELTAAGVNVARLPAPRASRPLSVRRARRALAAILAHDSFDCVVCHAAWSQAFFGGVVRRAGVPLVFWAHDAVTGTHWTERLAKRIAPDLAICNSAYTEASLDAMYPQTRTAVIAYPVDVDRVKLSTPERHALRQSLDTTDAATVVVQTSRLEAWKGHAVLLEALGRMASRSDWTCWIAGGAQRPHEAAYVSSLRSQAQRLGIADRIRWLGERQDVRTVLAAADVHCQPNVGAEPFGIAFIEALASGLPVVATTIGAALEIVDDSCGRLVTPEDPSALAAVLTNLVDDAVLRHRLAEAAPARARHISDPSTQLRRLFDALSSVTPAGRAVSCRA